MFVCLQSSELFALVLGETMQYSCAIFKVRFSSFCIDMMLTHCSRCICTKVSRFELCYLLQCWTNIGYRRMMKTWRLHNWEKYLLWLKKWVFSVRSSFSWIFIMYKWIMSRDFPFGSRPKLMKSMKSWRLGVVGECLLLNLLRKLAASTQGLVFQRSNWNLQDRECKMLVFRSQN